MPSFSIDTTVVGHAINEPDVPSAEGYVCLFASGVEPRDCQSVLLSDQDPANIVALVRDLSARALSNKRRAWVRVAAVVECEVGGDAVPTGQAPLNLTLRPTVERVTGRVVVEDRLRYSIIGGDVRWSSTGPDESGCGELR